MKKRLQTRDNLRIVSQLPLQIKRFRIGGAARIAMMHGGLAEDPFCDEWMRVTESASLRGQYGGKWSYPVSVDKFRLVSRATPRCLSSKWIGLS